VGEATEEVETVLRAKEGKKYLFLLNYSFKSQKVVLRRALRDLFSESEVSGTLDMKPFEVRVLGWEE
jgi:beta-galactosidase